MNTLVENQFGHGAKVQGNLVHKLKRLLRSNIGMVSIPFDWSKGVIGKTEYNIKNQFQSFSCWGQMFSQMVRIFIGGEELSAKAAYSPIYAPGTGGVYLAKGITEAKVFGITTEAKVPSKNLYGGVSEPFMEDKSWMSASMIDDCFTRRGWKVVNVAINVDSMAQAIRDYGCIGILIHGQNNGSWLSQFPTPPDINSTEEIWAHFMCSKPNIRPQVGTKQLDFSQSWGEQVGLGGVQTFDEKYINSGYIVDVFTFIKV